VDRAIVLFGSLTRPGDELQLVFRRFDRVARVGHQYMPLAAAPDRLVGLHNAAIVFIAPDNGEKPATFNSPMRKAHARCTGCVAET